MIRRRRPQSAHDDVHPLCPCLPKGSPMLGPDEETLAVNLPCHLRMKDDYSVTAIRKENSKGKILDHCSFDYNLLCEPLLIQSQTL